MPVKIIMEPDNFLLVGASRGFQLIVDCSERLRLDKENQKLNEKYFRLLDRFSEASAKTSVPPSLIDEFNHHYWLHRHPVFEGERFARILAPCLSEIRSLPDAGLHSIGDIYDKFETLRAEFKKALPPRRDPLPEVSLSKLLHCIRPTSFWILDSRVNMVLDIWGYPTSYSGFRELLEALFQDREIEHFRAFLEEKNRQLAGDYPPCSFLKLLDKVLWLSGKR